MLKEVSDFQEQLKKYKERAKAEREVYEKLLVRADKVISFIYNGSINLSKTIGKILHHLLLKMPFDMKEITSKILVEDIGVLHEWVLSFEKSEFLKKAKIFRNIADKIHFYKKLELPLLQDAYNRLFEGLRNSKALADEGEYSLLNQTSTNLCNASMLKSKVSLPKDLVSLKTNDFEDYNTNFLDELNNASVVNTKRENITDLLVRFSEKLNAESITDIPPVLLDDFIKKFKTTVDSFHSRIISISVQPRMTASAAGYRASTFRMRAWPSASGWPCFTNSMRADTSPCVAAVSSVAPPWGARAWS